MSKQIEITEQTRFWKELTQLKFEILYLEIALKCSDRINTSFDVVLAISSSSSIAGWVIWNKIGFVWATIITVSQVLLAIKHLLPFKERIRTILLAIQELEILFIKAEEEWDFIRNGEYNEFQIRKALTTLKNNKLKISQKQRAIIFLNENKAHIKAASKKTMQYFSHFHPSQGE